jgi:hypothetical protein
MNRCEDVENIVPITKYSPNSLQFPSNFQQKKQKQRFHAVRFEQAVLKIVQSGSTV